MSASFVSLIECGRRYPAPPIVRLLARKLGCSASYLVSGVDESVVNEIHAVLQRAWALLEARKAGEALALFRQVLSCPRTQLPDRAGREADRGIVIARTQTGDTSDRLIAELQAIAADLPETDQDVRASVARALTRCRLERGEPEAAALAAEHTLGQLTRVTRRRPEAIRLEAMLLAAYTASGDHLSGTRLTGRLLEHADANGDPGLGPRPGS